MSSLSRGQKALVNTVFYFSYILIDIVCAFIVPRLIITSYGSGGNGITSSITQFLSYADLFYMGIAGVTRAALYGPLNNGDENAVNQIMCATVKFMQRIACIFLLLLIVLAFIYPFFVGDEYSYSYTFSLTLILGTSSFFQYCFATASRILLAADQRNYIVTAINIFSLVTSTVVSILLISGNCSLHIVKLGTASVQIINPLVTYMYVKKKYHLNLKVEPDNHAIKQRWDAFAHSVANFVNKNTDIVIITWFANVLEVSVYTVYYLVINGINKVGTALSNGMESAFGSMIACREQEALIKNVSAFETVVFMAANIIYASCAVLIVPFVLVYTRGVTDVSYDRAVFGNLVTAAGFFATIRIPYQSVVQAAGKYRETRNGAITEALLNIVISLVFVFRFGLIGVSVGTLIAMCFRTCQYAVYSYKNILNFSLWKFIKRLVVSATEVFLIFALSKTLLTPLTPKIDSYADWAIYAVAVVCIAVIVEFVSLFVFWRQDLKVILEKAKNILGRKKKVH